jgi:uncharacterized membrane protein YkoI
MIKVVSSLVVAAGLSLALAVPGAASQFGGAGGGGGCLSDAQTRAAIQAGQARPLSSFIGQIQARMGGQVAGGARLCSVGGRLAYLVTILVGGQVREVRVDAMSGAVQ